MVVCGIQVQVLTTISILVVLLSSLHLSTSLPPSLSTTSTLLHKYSNSGHLVTLGLKDLSTSNSSLPFQPYIKPTYSSSQSLGMNKREKTVQLVYANLELSPRSLNIPILPTREEESATLQLSLQRNSKENIIPTSSQLSRGNRKADQLMDKGCSSFQTTNESQLKYVHLFF